MALKSLSNQATECPPLESVSNLQINTHVFQNANAAQKRKE